LFTGGSSVEFEHRRRRDITRSRGQGRVVDKYLVAFGSGRGGQALLLDRCPPRGLTHTGDVRSRNARRSVEPTAPKSQLDYLGEGTALNIRDIVRAGIPTPGSTVLEIGALCSPFFRKSEADVVYVDHVDTEALREKYRVGHGIDVNQIVEVDAVWGANTLLECAGRQVDYVIASHVVEHVPDLITWLKELRAVLKPGGQIRLVVPDKRFTFDYVRRETALQDLIDAYARRARRPLPANIFDHVTYARHVDVNEAWNGPLDPSQLEHCHSFEAAMSMVQDALTTENYHDVHCWVFTPQSCAALMIEAARYGLLDFECAGFCDTPCNSLEFSVFLRPSTDPEAIADSWKRVQDGLTPPMPDLSERVAKLKVEVQAKTLGLEAANARVAEVERALNAARDQLKAHQTSKSWRLTAPLRALRRTLQ
jgi:Uncharacterized protein conserved in bacteria